MKLIRKKRNLYALLFLICISTTVLLSRTGIVEVIFLVAVISIISFLLLAKQNRLLHDAMLIRDNLILSVPFDTVSDSSNKLNSNCEETVISTFGILIGCEIYQWGLDGMDGTRLLSAQIDHEKIYLNFGDEAESMRVELLHGMHQKQEVDETVQKLWRETGVQAILCDW